MVRKIYVSLFHFLHNRCLCFKTELNTDIFVNAACLTTHINHTPKPKNQMYSHSLPPPLSLSLSPTQMLYSHNLTFPLTTTTQPRPTSHSFLRTHFPVLNWPEPLQTRPTNPRPHHPSWPPTQCLPGCQDHCNVCEFWSSSLRHYCLSQNQSPNYSFI
jgi:hypothetical protein